MIEIIGGFFVRDSHYKKWKIERLAKKKKSFLRNFKLNCSMEKASGWISVDAVFNGKIFLGHAAHGIHIGVFHFNGDTIIMQNVTIGNKMSNKVRKVGSSNGDLFIGTNSFISDEITIGKNVIIGANSVVTKNVPENTLVTGTNVFKKIDIKKFKNIMDSHFDDSFTWIQKK